MPTKRSRPTKLCSLESNIKYHYRVKLDFHQVYVNCLRETPISNRRMGERSRLYFVMVQILLHELAPTNTLKILDLGEQEDPDFSYQRISGTVEAFHKLAREHYRFARVIATDDQAPDHCRPFIWWTNIGSVAYIKQVLRHRISIQGTQSEYV